MPLVPLGGHVFSADLASVTAAALAARRCYGASAWGRGRSRRACACCCSMQRTSSACPASATLAMPSRRLRTPTPRAQAARCAPWWTWHCCSSCATAATVSTRCRLRSGTGTVRSRPRCRSVSSRPRRYADSTHNATFATKSHVWRLCLHLILLVSAGHVAHVDLFPLPQRQKRVDTSGEVPGFWCDRSVDGCGGRGYVPGRRSDCATECPDLVAGCACISSAASVALASKDPAQSWRSGGVLTT